MYRLLKMMQIGTAAEAIALQCTEAEGESQHSLLKLIKTGSDQTSNLTFI